MPAYLSLADFKLRTVMPSGDVDAVEADTPGYTLARLTAQSAWIDARLRKRYAAPFVQPYPETILDWLTKIVTLEMYKKRGADPADQSIVDIKEDAVTAKAEIKEAADSEVGLFDLPLDDTIGATAIAHANPLSYSEAGPYEWPIRQAEAARRGR